MAQATALKDRIGAPRARVRTPGKYVVFYGLFPVALAALFAGVWLRHQGSATSAEAIEFRAASGGVKTAYVALPELLVDLAPDLDGRTAYLKTRLVIALEPTNAAAKAAAIEAAEPFIVERVTFFLRELRPEDFQGSENMARVKTELLRRINIALEPARVDEIVVEELVIQ